MKTRYEHINFDEKESPGVYVCRNNRTQDRLGWTSWDRRWQQYVFIPSLDCVFNPDCLEDVAQFIRQMPRKSGAKGVGR
jgi:hypothetical protein